MLFIKHWVCNKIITIGKNMLKKLLVLLMMPSLSWGATCVVPPKSLGFLGIWPTQTLAEFSSAHKGVRIVSNFDEESDSREGSLEAIDKQGKFDTIFKPIEGLDDFFVSHILFNVDKKEITSFAIMGASITDNINKEKDILISKTGIPSKYWVADNNQGQYTYLCDDYEVVVRKDDSRGELALILMSSLSEMYNSDSTNIEEKHRFTAKQLSTSKVQNRIAAEYISYSGYDLYENDSLFRTRFNEVFLNKLKLKIDDFDMSEALDATNFINGTLATYFWQKNKYYKDTQLTVYVAYESYNNHMLVVSKDSDNNVKVYGDKDSSLITAIIKSPSFPLEIASKIYN